MKTLVLLFLFVQGAWAETSFDCRSNSGTEVTLTYSEDLKQITWWDHTHSEFKIAPYRGIESAPYSDERDFLTFLAKDDDLTEKSGWVYKLEPHFQTLSTFRVVEVFDNDDHEEYKTEYECHRSVMTRNFK